jgi:ribosome-associated protein
VLEVMKQHGIKGVRAEGYNEARWVLLDYGDVVLHIFSPDDREFYRLEEFWRAAPFTDLMPEEAAASEEPSAVA